MKFLIATLAFVACASAAVAPIGTTKEFSAGILKQEQDVNPDGSYRFAYETDTGISANEEGQGGVQATGGASWTSPEGVPVVLTYTADENGYHPTGSHIVEVPSYVARALEYIRTHPGYEEPSSKSYQATKSVA